MNASLRLLEPPAIAPRPVLIWRSLLHFLGDLHLDKVDNRMTKPCPVLSQCHFEQAAAAAVASAASAAPTKPVVDEKRVRELEALLEAKHR